MCVINWINACKDEWLVSIKALQKGKNKAKKATKKREEEKEMIWFVQNKPMFANWVQNETSKALKPIKVDNKFFIVKL